MQDTRTPVVIVVVANVLSAIASPLLVYPAGLGIRGSALATFWPRQWVACSASGPCTVNGCRAGRSGPSYGLSWW